MKTSTCVECGFDQVYYIEFRVEGYSGPQTLYPLNANGKELTNDDLPKYLGGNYCHRCQGFCSTT